jgi:hypothetical protein
MAKLDHVVLATHDLDKLAHWLWEMFGLETQPGGAQGDAGTVNRYVPLGDDQYIELLAISNPASRHPMVTALKRVLADGDRLLNFALVATDIEATARRLNEGVFDVETRGADGKLIAFRLTGVSGLIGREPLPWFVETTAGQQWRGGFRPASHRINPKGISRVEFGGDAERIAKRIDDPSFRVTVTSGRAGLAAIWIRTAEGEVEIRL